MSYVIEILNLSKKFPQAKSYLELLRHPSVRKEVTALENINIRVRKGELFGLLGPNGAGKTTLIKVIATIVLPTEGSAFVNRYDVSKHEKEIKKIIGYVISEERSFYWRLTGRQNLHFFATLNNMSTYKASERIKEVVELVEMKDDIDKEFQSYSSGMKQKLAIARGMLTNPEILLLDEPTRNLDPIAAQNLRTFVRDVLVGAAKKTVVIATNNMHEAEELCNRVAIMHKGTVKICESLEEIRKILKINGSHIFTLKGSNEYIRQKLPHSILDTKHICLMAESEDSNESLLKVETNNEKEDISEMIEKIVMSGIKIKACTFEEFSLDEIFSKIVE